MAMTELGGSAGSVTIQPRCRCYFGDPAQDPSQCKTCFGLRIARGS